MQAAQQSGVRMRCARSGQHTTVERALLRRFRPPPPRHAHLLPELAADLVTALSYLQTDDFARHPGCCSMCFCCCSSWHCSWSQHGARTRPC
jgi:hypothetical protein